MFCNSDTSEGRTIFVRNLSFEVDHDKLYSFFADFGPLEFAKVVQDRVTQQSRGSGFVKFSLVEDARRVLDESCNPVLSSKFTLDNRPLRLSLAVSREEAEQLRGATRDAPEKAVVKPQSEAEDLRAKGRNLHLAKVGMIRAGTAAAEGMTKEDMAKREALLRSKKSKLRNPNIFISDVRLCVRNLPLKVTDEELRLVCLRLLDTRERKRITECRIMRNLEPGRQQFRSLGYAFVTCTTHQDALKVLHGLNNNADIFPGQRRPIVEFSLENMLALEKKRKRAERSMAKRTGDVLEETEPAKRVVQPLPPVKPLRKHATLKKAGVTRVLPKHLGPKKRHSRRNTPKPSLSKKPRDRLSRKQKRLKKATG